LNLPLSTDEAKHMTLRKSQFRRRRGTATGAAGADDHKLKFFRGESWPVWEIITGQPNDEASLHQEWLAVRDLILAEFVELKPGTRPRGWWAYDAPEAVRKRLGGTGTPLSEPRRPIGGKLPPPRYADWHDFLHGLPLLWEVDPSPGAATRLDPPLYESEAAFLLRHGLLLPDERERLKPADFAPERLLIDSSTGRLAQT
jgi:hypothetical protein